jgi:hypothetical protein
VWEREERKEGTEWFEGQDRERKRREKRGPREG